MFWFWFSLFLLTQKKWEAHWIAEDNGTDDTWIRGYGSRLWCRFAHTEIVGLDGFSPSKYASRDFDSSPHICQPLVPAQWHLQVLLTKSTFFGWSNPHVCWLNLQRCWWNPWFSCADLEFSWTFFGCLVPSSQVSARRGHIDLTLEAEYTHSPPKAEIGKVWAMIKWNTGWMD